MEGAVKINNELKHTPGPWTQDRNVIEDAAGNEIARVSYERSGYVQANARLIAAAPDLLEALRALTNAERDYASDPCLATRVQMDAALASARAAIAKGGSNE